MNRTWRWNISGQVQTWCLFVRHRHLWIASRVVRWKSFTFVRLSVLPSLFPSLTSPSSLAPFSVSLIYIFLVSFLGSHVIGLLSICSNVHIIAYMQLLDFFYCQFFCQFCTWNIWLKISTYLKDFSWKINGPKLARLCEKKKFMKHQTFMICSIR
jgi:hypothetical protein